jgi:hypothetical protein
MRGLETLATVSRIISGGLAERLNAPVLTTSWLVAAKAHIGEANVMLEPQQLKLVAA